MKAWIKDAWKYGYLREWLIALVVALCVWLSGWKIYNVFLSQTEKACKRASVEMNRPTKFVNLTWGSWSCMAKTDDGWIDISGIRDDGND